MSRSQNSKGGRGSPRLPYRVQGADPAGFRYGGRHGTVKTLLNGLGRGKAGFLGLLPCKGCSPPPPLPPGDGRGRPGGAPLVYGFINADLSSKLSRELQ